MFTCMVPFKQMWKMNQTSILRQHDEDHSPNATWMVENKVNMNCVLDPRAEQSQQWKSDILELRCAAVGVTSRGWIPCTGHCRAGAAATGKILLLQLARLTRYIR
jgi:hypothetical protein